VMILCRNEFGLASRRVNILLLSVFKTVTPQLLSCTKSVLSGHTLINYSLTIG